MKRLIYLTLFVISQFQTTNAQNFKVQLPVGYNKITDSFDDPTIEGSPYLIESWLPGITLLNNGKEIQGLQYRYNIYKDEMQFKLDNSIYIIGIPDSLKIIKLPGYQFTYSNYNQKSKLNKGYLQIATEGIAALYIKHIAIIIHANYNAIMAVGNKNSKYELSEVYYLKYKNQFYKLDKKGNMLYSILSNKQNLLKEYVSTNHYSLKLKSDLIKIIDYYNLINK